MYLCSLCETHRAGLFFTSVLCYVINIPLYVHMLDVAIQDDVDCLVLCY